MYWLKALTLLALSMVMPLCRLLLTAVFLIAPVTWLTAQMSPQEIERRIEYLERRSDFQRDAIAVQSERLTLIESKAQSAQEKANWIIGLGAGIAALMLANLFTRMLTFKKNGNGNGQA